VHRSVAVPNAGGFLRKLFAFMGPGYLVAVGYMDPGNWATSLAGGSAFGYTLLAVALTSSLMAILLQALCVRIGVSTGRDLAQLCRERFPKVVAYPLWLFAEIAICATDLAELIGTAIALELLFGIPLLYGVFLTALDAFLILWLQNKGVRWLEALIFGFIVLIVGCFGIQIVLSDPDWAAVLNGYIPAVSIVTNQTQLYIAMGILGATVMPHNLYLHTAVVQSRSWNLDDPGKREAIKFATIDSSLALTLALLINSAILITAAATFHASGNTEVAEIGEAYQLLTPLLGAGIAATAFGVALLLCGLNATVTATLAGQVVMEGFLQLRLPGWKRRLLTRGLALVPAMAAVLLFGESSTTAMLVLSQVVLSLQLPFAVIPLVQFCTRRGLMGELRAPGWLQGLSWLCAAAIVIVNVSLLSTVLASFRPWQWLTAIASHG